MGLLPLPQTLPLEADTFLFLSVRGIGPVKQATHSQNTHDVPDSSELQQSRRLFVSALIEFIVW